MPALEEVADLWRNLLPYHRRALLLFAFADSAHASTEWQHLPGDVRMRVVRGMQDLAALVLDCAEVIERAKVALDRDAPRTAREELQDKVDEIAFAPMPAEGVSSDDAAEYARQSARRVRDELADLRARRKGVSS